VRLQLGSNLCGPCAGGYLKKHLRMRACRDIYRKSGGQQHSNDYKE
jgi:hypothetical protein